MQATATKKKAAPRMTRQQKLLKAQDPAQARAYSSTERYAEGDVLQHAVFGLGVATAVKDGTKIEVLFESGSKLLIHAR